MTGYSTTPCPRRRLRKQDLVDGVDRAVAGTHVGLQQMRPTDGLTLAVHAEGDLADGRVADRAAGDGRVTLPHADRLLDDVAEQDGLQAGGIAQQPLPLARRE